MSMSKPSRGAVARGVALLCVAFAGQAGAADTVETWDVGATDVDFYLGTEGIGLDEASDRAVYGDIMLGYGLIERFSAYFGTTLQGDGALANATAAFYFGCFGTPIETDHFDLDLFLNISAEGPGFEQLQLAPALELNWDHDPEMRTAGVYMRLGMPVYGRETSSQNQLAEPGHDAAFHLEGTLGMYVTVSDSEQLFLELLAGVHPSPGPEEEPFDGLGAAIGYNVGIHDSIELITQVSAEIPHDDTPFSVGAMVGFIATLPSVDAP